jgi:hypothetical protein
MSNHAAIWLEQKEAHVFSVELANFTAEAIPVPSHVELNGHDQQQFFADILKAVDSATVLMVLGPSMAKVDFLEYLREYARDLRVVAPSRHSHPTDRRLADYVRRYFAAGDARQAEMGE